MALGCHFTGEGRTAPPVCGSPARTALCVWQRLSYGRFWRLAFAFILLKLFFPEALAQILGARSLGTPEQHILLRLESPCPHPELLSWDQPCAQ